eukprot:m.596342 g.596342  ORF g.596342 m.596342 type:complete len:219 (-) comp58049_c0_seq19:86-742(-)
MEKQSEEREKQEKRKEDRQHEPLTFRTRIAKNIHEALFAPLAKQSPRNDHFVPVEGLLEAARRDLDDDGYPQPPSQQLPAQRQAVADDSEITGPLRKAEAVKPTMKSYDPNYIDSYLEAFPGEEQFELGRRPGLQPLAGIRNAFADDSDEEIDDAPSFSRKGPANYGADDEEDGGYSSVKNASKDRSRHDKQYQQITQLLHKRKADAPADTGARKQRK